MSSTEEQFIVEFAMKKKPQPKKAKLVKIIFEKQKKAKKTKKRKKAAAKKKKSREESPSQEERPSQEGEAVVIDKPHSVTIIDETDEGYDRAAFMNKLMRARSLEAYIPSAKVDKPSAQVDMPSAQVDMPSAQVDKPSAQVDMPPAPPVEEQPEKEISFYMIKKLYPRT